MTTNFSVAAGPYAGREVLRFSNILVRATNWVGDAVMCVPALQALRTHHPPARISILARPWVAGLYGRESFCDELIPYEAARGWRGLRSQYALARRLRTNKFDAAILLQNAFEAAALAWMARIPVRIGYDRDGRGFLLTHSIRLPGPGEIPVHQRFYYLELLKRAGVIPASAVSSESIHLEGAGAAAGSGTETFRIAGLHGMVVGLAPGAAYGGAKRWLPERFASSAVGIVRAMGGGSVAVFGSTQEQDICRQVAQAVEGAGVRCINFAGRTTLTQLVDCIAACEVFLTNDSGAMHIASALGVRTIAIFGATDHYATGPTGENARVVRHPVECSPCLLRECPIDHRCMTGVTVDRVVDEALLLVAARK